MESSNLRIAFIGLVISAAALSQADSWSYADAGVFTSFSDAGADLQVYASNNDVNEFYNENDPPSFGVYTNSPTDFSSPANVLNPNIITAAIESTASGYAYTGWVNENETVYAVYNAGTAAESITVTASAYATANDGISGSGGSALFDVSGNIVEDFSGNNWSVSASLQSTQFSNYGLQQTSANGTTTISVNPNQTLDFVAYDYDITEAYSNATPEPFAPGLLALSTTGLILRRRKLGRRT